MTLEMKKHNLKPDIRSRLREVVTYIVVSYSVMWFEWKCAPDMKDAPKHVFKQVQLLQYLPESTVDVVKPFVKSWFCHPESLQIAGLSDDNPDARSFIVDKILDLRDGSDVGDTSKRIYKAPPLNFNATSYLDLIDWNAVPITESILTASFSTLTLNHFRDEKLVLPPFPSHTQSVERVIREITDVSGKCVGFDSRHGMLLARYASRAAAPKVKTKRDMIGMIRPVLD